MLGILKRVKCHVISEEPPVEAVEVYEFPGIPELKLGEPVVFAGLQWVVQHLEDDYVYLALDRILGTVQFGETNSYVESKIWKSCQELERHMWPFMKYCAPGNRYNDRVFIPTIEQYDTEWDWPSSDRTHRVVKDEADYETCYWTSSPSNSSYVWNVGYSGSFNDYSPTGSFGFRPAVKVRYKLTNNHGSNQS